MVVLEAFTVVLRGEGLSNFSQCLMKIFLSPLGRQMGVLSKENWEGGQGRKEEEWWRGKDDILPIGNGKGSG